MSPTDGNFASAQAMMPGQIQEFRIKAKPFNCLLLEEDSAAVSNKGFESTLGIHESQPENQSHDLIENNSGKLTE
jgi:hypothetical protein